MTFDEDVSDNDKEKKKIHRLRNKLEWRLSWKKKIHIILQQQKYKKLLTVLLRN